MYPPFFTETCKNFKVINYPIEEIEVDILIFFLAPNTISAINSSCLLNMYKFNAKISALEVHKVTYKG